MRIFATVSMTVGALLNLFDLAIILAILHTSGGDTLLIEILLGVMGTLCASLGYMAYKRLQTRS